MKKMNNSKHYASITNIEELRLERAKHAWKVQRAEDGLRMRYQQAKQTFTVGNIISVVSGQFDAVQLVAKAAFSGYEYVSSLINERRKKSAVKRAIKEGIEKLEDL